MTRFNVSVIAMIAATLAACAESPSAASSRAATSLAAAFAVTPAGFNQLTSSFAASQSTGPFQPHFGHGDFAALGLMGGGLCGPFLGDGLEAGFGHGPFGRGALTGNCTYSSATGVVTCDPVTIDGLTITRTAEYTDAAGQPQAAVDSTTNTISTQLRVAGTVTRRDSSTSTVQESSNQTITGLARPSTQRTVNGTANGLESTIGVSDSGSFTSLRQIADTTRGLVLPVPAAGTPAYPVAGTVIRTMQVTVTFGNGSPTTNTRRETVTYDGSSTATVVITTNGVVQNCTLPLPRGRLTCS